MVGQSPPVPRPGVGTSRPIGLSRKGIKRNPRYETAEPFPHSPTSALSDQELSAELFGYNTEREPKRAKRSSDAANPEEDDSALMGQAVGFTRGVRSIGLRRGTSPRTTFRSPLLVTNEATQDAQEEGTCRLESTSAEAKASQPMKQKLLSPPQTAIPTPPQCSHSADLVESRSTNRNDDQKLRGQEGANQVSRL